MKNNDLFITEISEEDFRKLDIVAYETVKTGDGFKWVPVHMNDVLDKSIEACLTSGCKENAVNLLCPFTVAIHKCNCPDPNDYYLEKIMNNVSGPRTYQFAGYGIKHLYSTRDYFEDHEVYWRVLKRETKSIYRIHLDSKWFKKFKPNKHK